MENKGCCRLCVNLHEARDGRKYCLIATGGETIFEWIPRERLSERRFCIYFRDKRQKTIERFVEAENEAV